MIYLIGGPPRSGKTTLAKKLSKKLGVGWLSTDALEVVSSAYVKKSEWRQKYPYTVLRRQKGQRNNDHFYSQHTTAKIISVLKKQARSTALAIEMLVANELDNGNDYILEGYHLMPAEVNKLLNKYGKKKFKVVFITKLDAEKFARDVHKSTTPNDWLLVLTKKKETFLKVGKMVASYSSFLEKEAKKYNFRVIKTDQNFSKQISEAANYLLKK